MSVFADQVAPKRKRGRPRSNQMTLTKFMTRLEEQNQQDQIPFHAQLLDVITNNSLGDCTIMTVSSWKNTESSQSSMSSSSKGIVMIQSDYSYLQDDKTINSLKVSWS